VIGTGIFVFFYPFCKHQCFSEMKWKIFSFFLKKKKHLTHLLADSQKNLLVGMPSCFSYKNPNTPTLADLNYWNFPSRKQYQYIPV
jgi:hypothetical protein